MIASRSSKGINALFIAFTVTRCKSAKFQPNAPINSFISWVIEVLDINRLSVLTVILNLNLAKTPIGCSAIVFAAFAFTLWDTDPSRWSLTSRGLYCCLSILVGGFAVAACEEFHT